MINISLVEKTPIAIYTCNKYTPVNTITEIISPVVSTGDKERKLEARKPWSDFAVANEWSYRYGIYRWQSWPGDNYLEVIAPSVNLYKVKYAIACGEELALALLQKNENNGFQVALCNKSSLRGVKLSSDTTEAKMIFELNECEMVYDR
jgi:hypothetical protein